MALINALLLQTVAMDFMPIATFVKSVTPNASLAPPLLITVCLVVKLTGFNCFWQIILVPLYAIIITT